MINICCSDEEKIIIDKIYQESKHQGYRIYLDSQTVQLLHLKKDTQQLGFLLEGNIFLFGEKLADLFYVEPVFDYAQAKVLFKIDEYQITITGISLTVSNWLNRLICLHQYLQSAFFTFDQFAMIIKDDYQLELYDPFGGYKDFQKGIIKTKEQSAWRIKDILHLVDMSIQYKFKINENIKAEIKKYKKKHGFHNQLTKDQAISLLEDSHLIKKLKLLYALDVLNIVFPMVKPNKLSPHFFDYVANDFKSNDKNYRLWLVNLYLLYLQSQERTTAMAELKNTFKAECKEIDWFIINGTGLKSCQLDIEIQPFQLHRLLFNTPVECDVLLKAILEQKRNKYLETINEVRKRTNRIKVIN